MSKLFAFENADVVGGEVELETPVEAGEVADVEVDVMEEGGEIEEQAEAIEEGMSASDQMEQVEELVEQAAEEGEGLDPVAAEAIRIAVEAICARVGANPKSMYALYATENFQSASSRKANTRFALEGVSEFLKDLWKKIKAALENLWAKVKAFWDKHVSSLGRIKKALESMKKKVSSGSGKFKDQGFVEKAPSFLVSSFPVASGDITKQVINSFIDAHVKGNVEEVVVTTDGATSAAGEVGAKAAKNKGKDKENVATESAALTQELTKYNKPLTYGTEAKPLVGGITLTWTFEVEDGDVTVTVTEDTVVDAVNSDVGVILMEKSDLNTALGNVISIINADIKAKASLDRAYKTFEKTMDVLKNEINSTVTDTTSSEAAKELRKSIKAIYALQTNGVKFLNKATSLDVRLAKAVLGYAGLCLKNYK